MAYFDNFDNEFLSKYKNLKNRKKLYICSITYRLIAFKFYEISILFDSRLNFI
jgi:hypothetical protein